MEGNRLKYPVGVQDFAKTREEGCVYVDKTDLVYDMVKRGQYIFLSRPRRFGKSLLLSTIRYYFEGRRDLFEGLKIMELERDWKKHPVLYLSLGAINAKEINGLEAELKRQFGNWEKQYGVTEISETLSTRFRQIIVGARKKMGEKVVILVDEYDNPLINTLDNKEIHEANKSLLKSIYSNLKDMDEHIRFGMLTGVSRFSNTTIFSGLNNLKDISYLPGYSTICGFTEDDIRDYLWVGVESLAREEGCAGEEALDLLKKEYDGYHFSENLTDIYNPFSLLNCLDSLKISNYWMRSGVPTFLINKLNDSPKTFEEIFTSEISEISLTESDAAFDNPVSLMFQTGYLTIKGYDKPFRTYQLGIPNREVDEGLTYFLLGYYSSKSRTDESRRLREMTKALQGGKPEEFLEKLQALLEGISYNLKGKETELDFERTLFVIFHLLGFHVHAELATARGRIDLLVETGGYVYVMELKLDGTAEEALRQIEDKKYAPRWSKDSRKIFRIGINYDSAVRNIDSWLIEQN